MIIVSKRVLFTRSRRQRTQHTVRVTAIVNNSFGKCMYVYVTFVMGVALHTDIHKPGSGKRYLCSTL
jgi:hypothetical protein